MAVDNKSSAGKVLRVLRLLFGNFAHGLSSTEISKATGFSPSDITRYVNTLEQEGFAERIPETNRIRPSINHAKWATQIQQSLNSSIERQQEINQRIHRG